MRKIIYKTLQIQNFLSIGHTIVRVDFRRGLNQIDGKNIDAPERKNGCGKSVVQNAHFFALFGETIDKIKGEFIVNNVTNSKGVVELEFDVTADTGSDSYKIRRHIKPSKVELFKNGDDITLDSIANTNRYICDLLQTNPTIHRCCDVMTVRDTVPFMSMKPEDKRKFIEDIFSINIFGIMLKDLKKLISETKTNHIISSEKLIEINRGLDVLITQRDSVKEKILTKMEVLEKRKMDLTNKIEGIKSEILTIDREIYSDELLNESLEKFKSALSTIDGKIVYDKGNIHKLQLKISQDSESLRDLSNIKVGVKCLECYQDIPHTHEDYLTSLRDTYTKNVETYKIEVQELMDTQAKYFLAKASIQAKMAENREHYSNNINNRMRLSNLKSQLTQYVDTLDDLESDMEDDSGLNIFDLNIMDTKTRRDAESENLDILSQTVKDLDVCKFILGEEGVKSFVIKKLLQILNNTIDKYLGRLGLGVRCKFDEYFEEVITSGNGKVFSYKNASGAEKKGLDFACAFSFSDMRRKVNQVSSNVEFFDEVFDTGLDSLGIDLIMDVIKERIDDHNLCDYVISHRKEMVKHFDGELILLEKKNGLTTRIL